MPPYSNLVLMDFDRLLGDFREKAYEMGLGQTYEECKDNPSAFKRKVYEYKFEELKEIMNELVEGWNPYPSSFETIREMKKRGRINIVITDNPMSPFKEKLMDKFSENGRCYLDDMKFTFRFVPDNGGIKIEEIQSKENLAKEMLELYDGGVLIVEGKNDVKAVVGVREWAEKNNINIKTIKAGNNCVKLNDKVHYSVENLPDVLDYI